MTYSDSPIQIEMKDQLGRKAAVRALFRLLADERLETPLVVGVYGGWGTGKTSVMRMLESLLVGKGQEQREGAKAGPEVLTLWFDAWKYARQEQSLWRALLLEVVEALRRQLALVPELDPEQKAELGRKLDELVDSLYRSLTITSTEGLKVNWNAALPFAADMTLRVLTGGLWDKLKGAVDLGDKLDLLGAFLTGRKAKELGLESGAVKAEDFEKAVKLIERVQSQRYRAHVQSLDQFQQAFREVLAAFAIRDPKPGERARRLFVFVDDLDRCLPEDAVAALEATKLFLDLPGCVFVLGMDREVVEQGIRARYKDLKDERSAPFRPRDYLDKVIQIPFNLPPLGAAQIEGFLGHLGKAQGYGLVQRCQELIVAAAPGNPRTLKRVVNVLQLTLFLDGWDGEELSEERVLRAKKLAKMVLLQICFDTCYRAKLKGEVGLYHLQEVRAKRQSGTTLSQDLLQDKALERLLEAEPVFKDEAEVDELLTLVRITASGPLPEAKASPPEAVAIGGKA